MVLFHDQYTRRCRQRHHPIIVIHKQNQNRPRNFRGLFFCSSAPSSVFRWKPSTNTTDTVVTYLDFLLAGIYGIAYLVTPNGEILALSTRDLYALDVDLP